MDWIAFDGLEPYGSRNVPDLLALLIAITANIHRKEGRRPWMPQDIYPDPLLPRRLTEAEEVGRTAAVAADYRRLRAERLARERKEATDG